MKIRVITYLMFMILFSSCQKEELVRDDHFFVTNDEAIMPVYLRGNLESDAIILFLHGGPGGNASQATFIPSFRDIENSYAIAYWDQRASGLSQGNPGQSTYSVEQFVEDTYFIVEALKLRFPGGRFQGQSGRPAPRCRRHHPVAAGPVLAVFYVFSSSYFKCL